MRKMWRYFYYAFTICFLCWVEGINAADGTKKDVFVKDVIFSVSPNVSVCLSDNVVVSGNGAIANSGRVLFVNSTPVTLSFQSVDGKNGTYVFNGSSDCSLLNDVEWGAVSMQTQGGTLFLDGDLHIRNSLELNAGVIDAGIYTCSLGNSLPNSLSFNNLIGNKSYVTGSFSRSVDKNGSYWFPVGGENGFHPFLIQNAEVADEITVVFDDKVAKDWASALQGAAFSIEDFGGWLVDANTTFTSALSLLDDKQNLLSNANYSIVYAKDESEFSNGYIWNQLSVKSDIFYLINSEKHSKGIYALASDGNIELANFVFDSGSSDNHFEIPEISKYTRIELTVYDRWGLQVFKSRNYYNEFDCSDFPQGTYFYELKLYQGESAQLVRNIIEVKRENN